MLVRHPSPPCRRVRTIVPALRSGGPRCSRGSPPPRRPVRGWSSSPKGPSPPMSSACDPVDPQQLEDAARDVIAVASRTGATIVYGGAACASAGLANSAYVVTPGGIAGFADKCFLWHFDRRWFTAGDGARTGRHAGRQARGLHLRRRPDPDHRRALVAKGAEVLVVPTAWVTSGRDPRRSKTCRPTS